MKKSILLLCILITAQIAVCMDDAANEGPQNSGFGILAFAGNVTNWFTTKMTEIDDALSGQTAQEEHDVLEDANTKFVQSILASGKNLNTELERAVGFEDPKIFMTILIGMQNLGVHTGNAELKKTIQNRLSYMQLQRRQITSELLEKSRIQEQQIHALRKVWSSEENHSDDESYETLTKYAQKFTPE